MQLKLLLAGANNYDPSQIPWDEWRYVQFAEAFGWTPQQVDEIPVRVVDWLLPIRATLNESRADRQAKIQAARAQQGGRHRR